MKTYPGKARTDRPTLRQPTQTRSRESTEALLEIGRRLIEQRGVDDCSMNEVAAAAGSSVGSLYFRFGNKERFVSEVMRRQVDATREQIASFLAKMEAKVSSPPEVIEAITEWLVVEYRKNQGLLRAQIRRALDDPKEWQPFQKLARELVDGTIRILERSPDVPPDTDWQKRVRIIMQMILGTLNNAIINRPGPLELTDDATGHELSRAALRYLRWDGLPETKSAKNMSTDVTIKAPIPHAGRKARVRGRT
jgi:AcrR family transcriptional regulator